MVGESGDKGEGGERAPLLLLLPEVAGRLEKLGAVAQPMDQRAFADFVREEIVATAALIRQAGIRVE